MFSSLIRQGLAALPRPNLSNVLSVCESVRAFQTSSVLCAEPLKKKKRLDPAILKMREQRRIRKLEKSIRFLKKHAKKLKPIDEMEVSPRLQKELTLRKRDKPQMTENAAVFREDLIHVWTMIKSLSGRAESKAVIDMVKCQQKALEELRFASPVLYEAAVIPDEELFPVKLPVLTETPPIVNYETPDGKYTDISKKWRP